MWNGTHVTTLVVKAERKCADAKAELQIIDCQGRAEVWKRNFRSLAVKTKRKCGSRTSNLRQVSPVGSAEADVNIFDRPFSSANVEK